MSINIAFIAKRDITINCTGKQEVQQEYFDSCWMTPSHITRSIIDSEDPFEAYRQWVLSVSYDEIEDVFAEDDFMCEREPIGSRVYNMGEIHVKSFNEWLQQRREDGYDIEVSFC
jgi:hypothetical protein